MKKYYFLLAALAMTNFACCKSQNPEREDYVCQDGFYFSREGGSTIPTDTALHQGFLSDGTRYFLYKNEREDYPHDSCIVQRVVREAEQAVIAVGNIEYEKALRRIEENRFSGIMSQFEGRIDLRIPTVKLSITHFLLLLFHSIPTTNT